MDYVTLYGTEGHGSDGSFGIKILVAATNLPDLKDRDISNAAHEAYSLIEKAFRGAIRINNPNTLIETKENRKVVDEVFIVDTPIFIEEIPNGYCKDWCCTTLPWFVVTTKVGRITIGWRKRVINIDWSTTIETTKTSKELFADEYVTKGDKFIHAWSIEKAREYITKIINDTK